MNLPWIDNPQWEDVALLAYIGTFGFLCAVLIIKETRLGWAMFTKNLTYALAFAYGATIVARPDLLNEDVRRTVRLVVAMAITWAIFELVLVRVQRWRSQRKVA